MKHRVFAYVDDNPKRGTKSAILGLDEAAERFFCAEVEGEVGELSEELERGDGSPAAAAFAAFERFCREECGLKDRNDEVIFEERARAPSLHDLADYVDRKLGTADWATVRYIASDYRFERAHVKEPLRFLEFLILAGQGMPEPYATCRIYQRYRKLIHKDSYTAEELDRMEGYIFSHLGEIYRRRRGRGDAIRHIAYPCAAIYRSDQTRFLQVIEKIIADYPRRSSKERGEALRDFLEDTSCLIYREGEIDLAAIPEEEKKPPLSRKKYAIFAPLSPNALPLVKELIGEYEDEK